MLGKYILLRDLNNQGNTLCVVLRLYSIILTRVVAVTLHLV